MMGKNEQAPSKQQWTGYELTQINAEPAPAEVDPLAEAPKADAPVPEVGNLNTNKYKEGTPQYSYETKVNQRILNNQAIALQKKIEADKAKEHADLSAQASVEAEAIKSEVKGAATVRRQGGVTYGVRALTQ